MLYLKGELVQEWSNGVEASIQDDQNRFGLFRTISHRRLISFVGVQFLLNHLSEFSIALKITVKEKRIFLFQISVMVIEGILLWLEMVDQYFFLVDNFK